MRFRPRQRSKMRFRPRSRSVATVVNDLVAHYWHEKPRLLRISASTSRIGRTRLAFLAAMVSCSASDNLRASATARSSNCDIDKSPLVEESISELKENHERHKTHEKSSCISFSFVSFVCFVVLQECFEIVSDGKWSDSDSRSYCPGAKGVRQVCVSSLTVNRATSGWKA